MAEKKTMKIILIRAISDKGKRYEPRPEPYEFEEKLAIYLIDVRKAYSVDSKEGKEYAAILERQKAEAKTKDKK